MNYFKNYCVFTCCDRFSYMFVARRINRDDMREAFGWLNKDQTRTFICGPSPMITDMEQLLIEQGIDKKFILYEKWW